MPASDLVPDPRARPSRTLSAWSSRLCASRTATAPVRCAASASAAYRAVRAAASGPPFPGPGDTRGPQASHGFEAEAGKDPGHLAGLVAGAGLEPVIHGDAARAQPAARALMRQGGGQGERIGPARASGQHQIALGELPQAAADGGTDLRDRRLGAHRA